MKKMKKMKKVRMDYSCHGRYESMVSVVSRRYMRGENGTESLVVCLCEYLPLCSVYHIMFCLFE